MAVSPYDITGFNLRIRRHLRVKLERAAKREATSINAEINRRLEASFKAEAIVSIEQATERMRAVTDKMKTAWANYQATLP